MHTDTSLQRPLIPLGISDVAEMLDMDRRTVRGLANDGHIACDWQEDGPVFHVEDFTELAWHRPKHLARELGVSTNLIRERINRGEIEATKFGVEWRIGDEAFQKATSHTE